MTLEAPNGDGSLPPCICTHAGERHRSRTKGTAALGCEVCGCSAYQAQDPDRPRRRTLTHAALQAGRRPPVTPL